MKIRLTALFLILSLFLFAGCASTAPVSDTIDTAPPVSTPVTSTPEAEPQPEVQEPTTPEAQQPTQPDAEEPVQPETTVGTMTREEAIAAALSAANLTEDDILYIWAEYEIDDGVPEYEVEFRTTDTEYDYTIHAETGAILSWDQEAEHAAQMTATNPTATTPLTEAEAITIVLTHAKLSESDVTHLHVEYGRDDNNFEVEFYCNRMEYTYEIDAATGTILDYEIDD